MVIQNKPTEPGYYWARCGHPDAPDWRQDWHLLHVKQDMRFAHGEFDQPLGVTSVGRDNGEGRPEYTPLDHLTDSGGSWYFEKVETPDTIKLGSDHSE